MDENKFIEFYNEYAPKLYKYCYFRVSSKEDAEDLASRAFTKTWDYLAKGNKIDNMRAFIYRTAHNLIIDFYKTSKKDREVSINSFGEDTIDIPEEPKFVNDTDTRMMIADVQKKLEQMNEGYREIIILRYINELSIPEIAKVLDMSDNNVSVKLHRATEQLKSFYV